MDVWNIDEIDHLHIDAQGSDFKVLQSLKAGQVECTLDIPLYSGVDNSHDSVLQYLESKGFTVEVAYIHNNRSEVDLRFMRK